MRVSKASFDGSVSNWKRVKRPMIEEIVEQIDSTQRLLLLVLLIQNELEFAYLRSTREIVESPDENDHPRLAACGALPQAIS